MQTTTQVTQMQPEFENGKMVLGRVTVVVNFQEPQNYFGGQVVLTKEEDGITFQTTQDEFISKGIAKAKKLIAEAELKTPYVPQDALVEPAHTDETDAESKGE